MSDDSQPYVIPTLYRSKISHDLSYPIGAEAITRGLSGASQLGALRLRFSIFRITAYYHLKQGNYEVIRVSHDTRRPEYLNSEGLPYFYEWEIQVSPVPRVYKSLIRGHIESVGLPQIRLWLKKRESQVKVGSELLAFFYDEGREQFYASKESQLQPERI